MPLILAGERAAHIEACIIKRHCDHKTGGSPDSVIKERSSARRVRAFVVILDKVPSSSSMVSERPFARVVLKCTQTSASGFRSGA